MKAIVHQRYGRPGVLELREIDHPEIDDDGVLVRVHATSVNPVDWYVVTGLVAVRLVGGIRRPKEITLGVDLAGLVEAVGKNVTHLEPGDEVFGTSEASWAEYAATSAEHVARKPVEMSFEQAAAFPVAAITALQALRDKGRVEPGQSVLINGASGGVGTFAVQLAKALGADVTAVCSTRNVEQARALGADRVVDYTKDDFTKCGVRHDLMLDIVGSRSVLACRRVLTPEATVVVIGGPMTYGGLGPLPHIAGSILKSRLRRQPVTFMIAKTTTEDLAFLGELFAAGKLTPVIDRTYPLSEASEAVAYLGEGHARGKVILTV